MAGKDIVAPANRPGDVKFEKIWNRAKDCDVASVVLHVNNKLLCIDDRHALTVDEVVDCCKHGCIIEENGVYYQPVSWSVKTVPAGVVAGVGCIGGLGNTSTRHVFSSYLKNKR